MELTQQNKTDLLEIVIILAILFLIVVIYLPVAIWEDEERYEKESRYRMENLYDVESFYSRLTGEYNPNFLEALSVVCESSYSGWYNAFNLAYDPQPLLEANIEEFKTLIKKKK